MKILQNLKVCKVWSGHIPEPENKPHDVFVSNNESSNCCLSVEFKGVYNIQQTPHDTTRAGQIFHGIVVLGGLVLFRNLENPEEACFKAELRYGQWRHKY